MTITEQEAIAVAKKVAEENSWPFEEPVKCKEGKQSGKRAWLIRTNNDKLGGNLEVAISTEDGSILRRAFLLR